MTQPAQAQADSPALPTGTVTFLFTDIEGSTRLIQELGAGYGAVLTEHRELVGGAMRANGGRIFGSEGDALFVAFGDAASAVKAAAAAQRALAVHPWPGGRPLRVRMGIHSGEAAVIGDDYVGLSLHTVARITAAGHGGQVLLSDSARSLAIVALPAGVTIRDLGEHRLKDLARPERLFELVIDGLDETHPALRTLDARPNNLPVQLTSFVGRRELETAERLLATTRLLTLTGPGGTGKTRLALQLAAEVAESYPDGVYFVALDGVFDPDLVPSAIADALGITTGNEPPLDRIIDRLRSQASLIVLDNFEQVVGAAATVIRLLREAPRIAIVVTSRIVLRASGEQEFEVPPLGLLPAAADLKAEDAAGSEAVSLFVERAMAVQPSFRLTDENAAVVADIVTRLDGLPLAIELAAARVRVLSVQALRTRLDDRLGTLTGGARDLPARQQTLRGAIDWSYDLLDASDRLLLRRFAVFSGGGCLGQSEDVCGPAIDLGHDVLDGLGSLIEKSLVRSVAGDDSETRFAMLATIREYALEKLAESDEAEAIRRRHALAYVALLERHASALTGTDGGRSLDRVQLDHDNFRAALDWAVATDDAEIAMRLVAGLWRFWQIRGHLQEAETRIATVLALPNAAAQTPGLRARAFGAGGSVAYWRGDSDAVALHYATALEEARRSDEKPALAEALYNSAFMQSTGGRVGVGRARVEQALALYRELEDNRGIANAEWALGVGYLMTTEWDAAMAHFRAALPAYRSLADPFGTGWALHGLALVEILHGDPRAGEALAREAMTIFAGTNDLSAIVLTFADFAEAAKRTDRLERAWRIGGAAHALAVRTGTDLISVSGTAIGVDLPVEPPDDPILRHAWEAGLAMTVEAVIAYALNDDEDRSGR